jgi:hypothetical protein
VDSVGPRTDEIIIGKVHNPIVTNCRAMEIAKIGIILSSVNYESKPLTILGWCVSNISHKADCYGAFLP